MIQHQGRFVAGVICCVIPFCVCVCVCVCVLCVLSSLTLLAFQLLEQADRNSSPLHTAPQRQPSLVATTMMIMKGLFSAVTVIFAHSLATFVTANGDGAISVGHRSAAELFAKQTAAINEYPDGDPVAAATALLQRVVPAQLVAHFKLEAIPPQKKKIKKSPPSKINDDANGSDDDQEDVAVRHTACCCAS